jgi:hypothetical protein
MKTCPNQIINPVDETVDPEPLIDVHFAESDLEQVISKRYGAAEAQRLKEQLK